MIHKCSNVVSKTRFLPLSRSSLLIKKPVVSFSLVRHYKKNHVKTGYHKHNAILSTRNSQLLRSLPPLLLTNMNQRGYTKLVVAIISRFTKLRYLVFTGVVAGGTSIYQSVKYWKDNFINMSWLNDYLPDQERYDSFKEKITNMKSKLSIDHEKFDSLKKKLIEISKMVSLPDLTPFVPTNVPSLKSARDWLDSKMSPNSSNKEEEEEENMESDSPFAHPTVSPQNKVNFSPQNEKQKMDDLHNQMVNQQVFFQKKLERLKKDNKELRKTLLLRQFPSHKGRRIKRSLIDMYSEVLDELADFEGFNSSDHLPRVVVVGDQSSGKTSVLEMIAQARIFPRGSGEMMTRSPVKVTLSEGPYHVAKFNNSSREYDLSKESELELLRHEIEMRMKMSVSGDQTVSGETISLTVKGPGLQRIVLVDLPGIISTVTSGMAEDTKDKIKGICKSHMENPNSIILCIQDGSLDAERSNVTDLVSSMDPSGKRTIFVLTKVDVAENNKFNPDRIKKILEGRLFPMKALGYFAVVTGRGNTNDGIQEINDYEQEFFKSSTLFKNRILKLEQMTTKNLSVAVSKCFWKMVRESIDQQADLFRATRFNLETEWKNTFPKNRQLDREELFEKGRCEILDQVINLSQISSQQWETLFRKNLLSKMVDPILDHIYLPASRTLSSGEFQTMVDIRLKQWVDKALPAACVEVGQDTIQSEFAKLLLATNKNFDPLFSNLKVIISKQGHLWDKKAEESLRVLQTNALEEREVTDKQEWENSIKFMESILKEKLSETEKEFDKLLGPSWSQQWLSWSSRTDDQNVRRVVVKELEKLVISKKKGPLRLTKDEVTTVRKNLETLHNLNANDDEIKKTWNFLQRLEAFKRSLKVASECRKGFYYYQKNRDQDSNSLPPSSSLNPSMVKYSQEEISCDDVVFFSRIEKLINSTSQALRQHVINNEVRRFEQTVKSTLNMIGEEKEELENIITGRRVDLAEQLKRVRQVQELLEEFIDALNKEKP